MTRNAGALLVVVALLSPVVAHAKKANVLWTAKANLDGKGKQETITLTSKEVAAEAKVNSGDARMNVGVGDCAKPDGCNATLKVGTKTATLRLRGGYFRGLGMQVVDIDAADPRKEILITQRAYADEDPQYQFWVALYDGKKLALQELFLGDGYNTGDATVDGKGGVRVVYDSCPDRTTVDYRLSGLKLDEANRDVAQTHPPDQCAACPFVYVERDGGFAYAGEILRNLNREALAGEQFLVLGRADAFEQTIVVELREEKDETTFLDEVYLDVDGVRVDPEECDDSAYCAADGTHLAIERGDVLRLTFKIDGARGYVRLVASGYYLPR